MSDSLSTPWEFYPDDDLREEPGMAAEDEAMHIEIPGSPGPSVRREVEAEAEVVHYLDDEDPEIPDVSLPVETDEVTPGVEALLIRQHYMTSNRVEDWG